MMALMDYGVRLRPALGDRTLSLLVVGSALSIAVATVSWFGLERPMNELKRRFPYPSAVGLGIDRRGAGVGVEQFSVLGDR